MTSPTLHDHSLIRTRTKRAVREFAPKLWLDGSWQADTSGAREFTAANNERFLLATAIDPLLLDFFVAFFVYGPAVDGSVIATGGRVNDENGFVLDVVSGKIRLKINDSVSATNTTATITDAALTANTWTHFAVNCDRDGLATCYVNGVLQTATGDISSQAATLGYLYANPPVGQGNNPFEGRMARLCYGTGLLTAADAAELYCGGTGRLAGELSTALAAKMTYYWNMNEASGNLVASIGSNTGTDTNTVTAAAGPAHASAVNAGVVSPWTSRSKTHHVLKQETLASRPTWTAATGAVTFDGTDDYLTKATVTLTSDTTGRVMIVCQTDEIGEAQVLYSQSDVATATHYMQLGISAANLMTYRWNDGGTVKLLTGNTELSTDWHVLEWESDGSTIAMKVDGAVQLLTEGTAGDNDGDWFGDVTGADNSTIGASIDDTGTPESPFTGQIAEIVAWEPDDTAANATRLRSRLARKASITLASGIGILLSSGAVLLANDGTGILLG